MTTTLLIVFILLACGIAAGFCMHRSDFCIAGMFRDIFLFRNRNKIKPLVILAALNLLLFHLLHAAGIIRDLPFPLFAKPNLLMLPGGILFGIGMVLAGTCVVGVLYKIGSGQVLALAAFLGMVMGNLIFLFTAPASAPVTKMLFLSDNVTIPRSLGMDPLLPALAASFISAFFIYRWMKDGSLRTQHVPRGYIDPAKTAAVLSAVSVISYILVNSPIGVTTSYAKMSSYFVHLLSPDAYGAMPVFTNPVIDYHNPFTDGRITSTMGYTLDGISLVQLPVIAGIIAGSALSAVSLGEFRPRFRVPARHYLSAVAGGILLAYSSRISLGCNIWHLAGGIPVLAWGGFLFLSGIFTGAWIGSFIMKRVVI